MSLKNTKRTKIRKSKKPSGTTLDSLHEASNESGDDGSLATTKNKGKGKNSLVVRIMLILETKSAQFIQFCFKLELELRYTIIPLFQAMIDPVQSSTTNKKNDLKISGDKKMSDMNSAVETLQITVDQQKKGTFSISSYM